MSDDGVGKSSPGPSRSRRSRQDKSERSAALEQLQQRIKTGQKNKFEVKQVENVFDVVDERENSKRVLERQHEDWIIDDGSGYVEDGREIFDDEMADDDSSRRRSARPKSKREKEEAKVQKEAHKAGFGTLEKMFSNMSNMPTKRKRSQVPTDSFTAAQFDDLPEQLQSNDKKSHRDTGSANVKKKIATTSSFEQIKASPKAPPKSDWIKPNLKKFKPDSITNEGTYARTSSPLAGPSKRPISPQAPPSPLDDLDGLASSDLSSTPPMVSESRSGKSLNFFWLEIFEERKNPGVLFIFGKVKSPPPATGYSSCCVVIKNLNRRIFLLPRAQKSDGSPVNYMDVYNEFKSVTAFKYKITAFKVALALCRKKYCLDIDGIPREADYMEVRYSGTFPALPHNVSGETFSHAFGTNTPLIETFLLDKKLKGPCWLQISNCKQVQSEQQQSWSKFEFTCDVSSLKIHPEGPSLPPPTLVLVSLNIQSVHDAAAKTDSIIFAGVAVNRNFPLQSPLPPNSIYDDSFCLLNKAPGEIWPLDIDRIINKRTLKMDSERSMLSCFLAKLHQLDADVYLGHDLNLELLMLQMLHFKVQHWSRIGRLKRSMPTTRDNEILDFRTALAGRLLCDVKISSHVLGLPEDQVVAFKGPKMNALFDSCEGLQPFVNWGMEHCVLNIRLINQLQVMPLAVQITCIVGNTLAQTLLGGCTERNEYLLLHAFNAADYIMPDKLKPFQKTGKKEGGKFKSEGTDDGKFKKESAKFKKEAPDGAEDDQGPSYSGGLVLAPKKGFYDDYIVLMDFNSLYPSIIQEFNVCFTTDLDGEGQEGSKGILPEEIRKLVECRKQVKSSMKRKEVGEDLMRQYDIRQKALKLTANSMYGCLGFKFSRFYAKNLAAYITGKGRDILMKTKESVEKMGFEVIYGDTDSLMINTNSQDVTAAMQIGNKIKSEVNRTYRLLELEIDGIFRFSHLVEKKKYAGLLYNPKSPVNEFVMEQKGLDLVRRNCAPMALNTAQACSNKVNNKLNINKVPKYNNKQQKGAKDKEFYPGVKGIRKPVPPVLARVNEALRPDWTSYKRRSGIEDGEDKFSGGETEAEKFSACEKFSFKCAKCDSAIVLKSALFLKNGQPEFSLRKCSHPYCHGTPLGSTACFMNQLTLFMRRSIFKYYKNGYTCTGPSCTNVSNTVPLYLERGGYPVCGCKQALMDKEYSDAQLYRQLNYLEYVFNLDKAVKDLKKEEKVEIEHRLKDLRVDRKVKSELEILYRDLQRFVQKTLSSSAYSRIDLKGVFQLIAARKVASG